MSMRLSRDTAYRNASQGREEEISENKLRGSSKRGGDRCWCAAKQACPRCKRFARLYAFYEGHVARDGRNYTS